LSYDTDLKSYMEAVSPPNVPATPPAWEPPKFHNFLDELNWAAEMASKFIGPPKPPKEKIVQHEIYPYIGTSDRQRAYLVKHGIKHVRKDGVYR